MATAPSTDTITNLMTNLLAQAPTEDEIADLKEQKVGALSAVQGAVSSSQRPENYSPFMEMVANYLKTMRPGWNQYGLSQAAAAPYFSEAAFTEAKRKEEIARTTLELKDVQEELRNQTSLQRSAIAAGATLARGTLSGLRGANGQNWMQVRTGDGVLLVNKNDPSQREYIPKGETAQWDAAMRMAYDAAVKTGTPNPESYAVDFAASMMSKRPKPIVPANAAQVPSVPAGASSGRDMTPRPNPAVPPEVAPAAAIPSETPIEPAAGQFKVENVSPVNAGLVDRAFGLGTDEQVGTGAQEFLQDVNSKDLRSDTVAAIDRILTRAERSGNPELQRNSLETVRRLVAADLAQKGPAVEAPIVEAPIVEAPAPAPTLKSPRDLALDKSTGEEEGKIFPKELHNLNLISRASSDDQMKLRLMRELFSIKGIPSGEQAERIQYIKSTLASLGVPMGKNVGAAQVIESISTNLALHQRVQGGVTLLPGAMSNYEDQLLRSIVPSLKNTPEGRLALIDMMEAMAETNQRFAREANIYAKKNKNTLDHGWYSRQDEIIKQEKVRLTIKHREILNKLPSKR